VLEMWRGGDTAGDLDTHSNGKKSSEVLAKELADDLNKVIPGFCTASGGKIHVNPPYAVEDGKLFEDAGVGNLRMLTLELIMKVKRLPMVCVWIPLMHNLGLVLPVLGCLHSARI